MNYRHIYHAGNFADVFKHVILVAIIEALQLKPKPMVCMDSHAGIGLYPLFSQESQIKQEFSKGIKALLALRGPMPTTIAHYIKLVKSCNVGDNLQFYPGSPMIIDKLLRPEDIAILCELHPDDVDTLRANFKGHKQVAIHHLDAYLGLKGLLPAKHRRGVVLIDPPFEATNEFEQLGDGLLAALKRWATGVYALWYPIKNQTKVNCFYRSVKKSGQPHLIIEFTLNNIPESGLYQCGMVIVNPPWTLCNDLKKTLLPYLSKALDANACVFEVSGYQGDSE